MKKVAVIGFGAASIGFIKGIMENGKIENMKVDIYERGKNIETSGFGGLKYDGKIFVSKNMGGDLEIPEKIQRDVVNFFLEKAELAKKINGKYEYDENIEHGNSFEDDDLYKTFYNKGFEPIKSEFYHIGTDILVDTVNRIYEEFSKHENINFIFDSNIKKVERNDQLIKVYNKDEIKEYDDIVIAVGRSGHKLVKHIIDDNPELILSNNKVDLGIRFELPDHIVQELNDKMYEFKIKLKTKTGYTVRTFCNNPSGEVTVEKYDDFVTVNGHANSKNKTKNTNFAILVTHSFTEPFNDPVGYGTYISKLSNILAGGNKVILQTYEDFKKSKRTKKIGRVEPTLNQNNYILGDLNLVFPRKTVESIIDFMETLNEIVPGITYSDNLLYGVEVKFYGNKVNTDYFNNVRIIGDCSGWTRSITYATCHGVIEANKI
ncbi:NAD(P)/FAD-dependent oxidoreductase [Oceanotoga sp. DSM 15011]|jgi:hypothetical protein|uniref:FAD-dependent protein C-terminal domain-containing protein n=1 Tax=Oceanotoga teriensis TaxID=515440 RepID=A0AA45C4S3_9BACT|nr:MULTISPECIES: dehydrogenase [Oceanotoga]MDN5343162.1 uncharacterized protein [Oceanotoga sp.]MDO7977756.1 NAD(P)/FAD-dependent oxidoreductase [Oceanotoga teriensis]PWJ87129.1 hypothetical protein C7380_12611 [Oceanotoga teriensis]UYP00755.1 NAD(P)/FAD-dependent oxidoreductase [Oceanotoga sp. DSM 15011]